MRNRMFQPQQAFLHKLLLVGSCCVLVLAAQSRKPLTIVNAALLEVEDGFAAPPDTVHLPGETLYLAFNIQGHTVDRSSRVKINYRIDALDPAGIPFVEPEIGRVDTELSEKDAKWSPRVRFSPAIPPFADSGKYRFALHVADEIGKTQVSQEVFFQVRGRNVPPSTELVVRNFDFSRQEDGDRLSQPAFRRGDVLWASFDITGYKIGDKNAISVDYGLAVLNSENKVIFEQPQPAHEQGTSFYPRRYVHAVFSLNLAGTLPGEYSILLKVRDALGNQTSESSHRFTVE